MMTEMNGSAPVSASQRWLARLALVFAFAAVVILLVVPPVLALGWLVVDSILGQI